MRPIKWYSETRIGNELTESERVFQKIVEAWTHHGLMATHTRKERKMVKLATFTLTFLIFGGFAFLMPTVQTQDPPILPVPPSPVPVNQTVPLEGNLTFTFYPDESIKMKVIGSIEQAIETDLPPPVYNAYLNLASSPSGVNLTDVTGTFVLKLNPMYSMLLAALELDIEAHSEGLRSNTTILFNMPGYLGVNGTTGAFTDESTGEGIQDFDLTITIWYSLLPKEELQGFIQTFPTLKSQIETQISELTEGNVTLKDLTYSDEIGFASATITITGSLVGDFVKGGNALSTNLLPLLGLEDPETTPLISPEDLMSMKAKSAYMHIWYDRNEFAFLMDSEGVIEGDLDRQINIMKDIYLEQILQSPSLLTPELTLMINDVLIPTEISTENLNVALEYSFDGEKLKIDFAVEGLVFRPPTTEAFLTLLDKALTGVSLPGFSLVLEGGSDEEGFVEIEVPPTTSEPVMAFPRKVVWIVDNLTNLNLVSFKVREGPPPPPPPPPPPLPPYLDNLTITPEEVEPGDEVTISFDIRNTDSQSITYMVEMQITFPIDVELNFPIDVELEAYESKTMSRTMSPTPVGIYNVTVIGMTGSFTVKSPPLPAEFVVSDLIITPEEVEPGDEVTISVLVTNIGEETGDYTVTMDCEDVPAGPYLLVQETVSLEGGESERVEFEVSRNIEGIYAVAVDGLTGSFTVEVPPRPAELEFSNLRIFYPGVIPPEVERGETVTVTVSIDVTNVGQEMGGCTVELKVNGEVVESVDIAAFGGIPPDYDQVTATQLFELTRGEGTYEVEVEGFTESFTVVIPEPPFWNRPEFSIAVIGIAIAVAVAGYILMKRS